MTKSKEGLIATIGLIASCIAIFAFATGWQSIWDIFKGTPRPRQPTATQYDPPNTEVIPLPTSTSDNQVTPVFVNVEPQLVESGENYSIEYICNGQTGAELFIQAPDFPYQDLTEWYIYSVVKDIKGNWQREFPYGGTDKSFSFSSQGTASETLPSGDWEIDQQFGNSNTHIEGNWGNNIVGEYYGKTIGFVFPTRDGCTTKINLSAAKLEIGILDTSGANALIGAYVQVFCQTTDIANNIIPDMQCPGGEGGIYTTTDSTGLANLYLGPGTYFLKYKSSDSSYSEYKFAYDIHVSSGEQKRVTVNYP